MMIGTYTAGDTPWKLDIMEFCKHGKDEETLPCTSKQTSKLNTHEPSPVLVKTFWIQVKM